MQFSAKAGWSAAGGMTFVAAVLAGLLWGRGQTTPAANAQPLQPWMKGLEVPQDDASEQGKERIAAEIAEIRERVNIRLFDHPVWNADDNTKETPTSKLMRVVTPRIIIDDEEEEKLLGNVPAASPVEKAPDGSQAVPVPSDQRIELDMPVRVHMLHDSDEVENFSFTVGFSR